MTAPLSAAPGGSPVVGGALELSRWSAHVERWRIAKVRPQPGETQSERRPETAAAAAADPGPAEQAVSSAVERILGRKPRTFADWAARTASAFR